MSVEPKVLPEVPEPSGVEDWWYLLGFPKHSLGLEEHRNLVITIPVSSAHRLTKADWRDPQVTWEASSPQVFRQSCPSVQAESSCCSASLPPITTSYCPTGLIFALCCMGKSLPASSEWDHHFWCETAPFRELQRYFLMCCLRNTHSNPVAACQKKKKKARSNF